MKDIIHKFNDGASELMEQLRAEGFSQAGYDVKSKDKGSVAAVSYTMGHIGVGIRDTTLDYEVAIFGQGMDPRTRQPQMNMLCDYNGALKDFKLLKKMWLGFKKHV